MSLRSRFLTTILFIAGYTSYAQLPEILGLSNPTILGDKIAASGFVFNRNTGEVIFSKDGVVTLTKTTAFTVNGGTTSIYNIVDGQFIVDLSSTDYRYNAVSERIWRYVNNNTYQAFAENGTLIKTATISTNGDNLYPYTNTVRYKKGALSSIYKYDYTASAEVKVGDFDGTFAKWYVDGEHFITAQGSMVRVYTKDAILVKTFDTGTPISIVGGASNFVVGRTTTDIKVYNVNSNDVNSYPVTSTTRIFITPTNLALVPRETSTFKVLKYLPGGLDESVLHGTGSDVVHYSSDVDNWATVSESGIVNYGNLTDPEINTLNFGSLKSMAGTPGGYLALNASSAVVIYRLTGSSIDAIDTILLDANDVQFKTDGTRLAAHGQAQGEDEPSLHVYDLSGDEYELERKWNYSATGFDLSENGQRVAQVTNFSNVKTSFTLAVDSQDSIFLDHDGTPALISSQGTHASTSFAPNFPTAGDDLTKIYENGVLIRELEGFIVRWISDTSFVFNRQDSVVYNHSGIFSKYRSSHIYGTSGNKVSSFSIPRSVGTVGTVQRISDTEFLMNGNVVDIANDTVLFTFPQTPAISAPVGPDHIAYVEGSRLKLVNWRTSAIAWYFDSDKDGFGNKARTTIFSEQPPGYVGNDDDCDDNNAAINPNTKWYADADGDGYGNISVSINACLQPTGYVRENSDCNDGDAAINPTKVWYRDVDGDGFGNAQSPLSGCLKPDGYAASNTDCNDTAANINPQTKWYRDADGDGFGDPQEQQTACVKPTGYISDNTDCNDTDAALTPANMCIILGDADVIGDLAVSPNPGNGIFTITGTAIGDVTVCDVLGRTIAAPITKYETTLVVDLRTAIDGMYVVSLRQGKAWKQLKILKN